MVPYPVPVTRAQRGHQRNKKQDFVGGEVDDMKFWWMAWGDSDCDGNLADLHSDGQSKGVYASFQAGAAWCILGPKAKIDYLILVVKLLLINMNYVEFFLFLEIL